MYRMLLFALSLLTATGAPAQTRDLAVIPANTTPAVDLDIRINRTTVAIGDTVEFSFRASRDGYVTLWDIGTSGKVTRIYPNSMGGDMAVRGGIWYGAGGADDPFRFRVGGPAGMEDVYLVWTREPAAQPKSAGFTDAQALSRDLTPVARQRPRDWATEKVTFEITPSGRPYVAAVPPPTTTLNAGGRVFILAMGANVTPLTKTNADARRFADTLSRLFRAPGHQVRLVEDARKADFAAGMDWLRRESRQGDLVLVFFSGHGSTLPDDDGDEADGYDEGMVMYDAATATYPSADHFVRDDEYARWVAALPTDRVVTVIDACHSGGLQRALVHARPKFFVGGDLGDTTGGMSRSQGTEKTAYGNVVGLVYAAAAEDESAFEVADGGLFVTRFLQEMGAGGHPHLDATFGAARGRVLQQSNGQQTPTATGDIRLGESLSPAN